MTVGLIGAFINIDLNSLWFDELYTAWVVNPEGGIGAVVSRALEDVVPPLYYFAVFPFVMSFGDWEIGLRILSVLCAVASICLFISPGPGWFSLKARFFAGAMATASFFWFNQAQNARGYALALLIGVAMLRLALSIICRPDGRSTTTIVLFAVMLLGSFVHFYVAYESLAILLILYIVVPRERLAILAFAGVLLLSVLLYVKLVLEPLTVHAIDKNWIPSDASWYLASLREALYFTFNKKALVALLIAGSVACVQAAYGHGGAASARVQRSGSRAPPGHFHSFLVATRKHGDMALFIGVPLLVLVAGVASSVVMAPNFTSRNLLVCSPFAWALAAKLYDAGVARSSPFLRAAAQVALCGLLPWMAVTMVNGRFEHRTEAFRETASWIANQPACKDQIIPVIASGRRDWVKDNGGDALQAWIYGKYLRGFAVPNVLYLEDVSGGRISSDLPDALKRRLDEGGCPVLAWGAHFVTAENVEAVGRELLSAMGKVDLSERLKLFSGYGGAYVAYVTPAR